MNEEDEEGEIEKEIEIRQRERERPVVVKAGDRPVGSGCGG